MIQVTDITQCFFSTLSTICCVWTSFQCLSLPAMRLQLPSLAESVTVPPSSLSLLKTYHLSSAFVFSPDPCVLVVLCFLKNLFTDILEKIQGEEINTSPQLYSHPFSLV